MSDITGIEAVQNEIVRLGGNKYIALRPRLKITVKSSESGSITTIVVAMPNAEQFASQLKQLTESTTGKGFEKEF